MTIDVGLPKWPRLLVKGEDVTEEQANEILIRTNGWWCFSTNDKRFERDVWRLANVEVDEKFGWPKDGETEQLSHELSALDLEYLHNNRIASAWIGGSHGWCDWNGTIGCSSHNIGKWPSADEVDAEWRTIAAAFPYLRLDAQLVDDEGEGNVLISWRIEDGDVVLNPMPNPRDFLRPVHEPDISGLLMSHVMGRGSREQGVSLDRLEVALAQVRA